MTKFNAPLYLPKGSVTSIIFIVAAITFAVMLLIDFAKTGTVDSALALVSIIMPVLYTLKRMIDEKYIPKEPAEKLDDEVNEEVEGGSR